MEQNRRFIADLRALDQEGAIAHASQA